MKSVVPRWRLAPGVLGITLLGVCALGIEAVNAQTSSAQGASPGAAERAVLDRYCVTCHNDRLLTAGLDLAHADVANVGANPAVWETVVRKLRASTMPPQGRPRPDQATYDRFATYLETSLDRAAATRDDVGPTEFLRRLTRTEYRNAVRDLLDLEIDVTALLPVDVAARNGFDNMEGILTVSPTLLDRYVSAAHKVSRLAVGLPPSGPVVETHTIPFNYLQDDRVGELSPLGSRGGLAVRHYFPVDGEYDITIRLSQNYQGYIRGLLSPHQVEIRVNGVLAKEFTVGGEAPARPAPAGYEGNIFGSEDWESYNQTADEHMHVRLPVRAGPGVVAVAFPREWSEAEGLLQPPVPMEGISADAMPDSNPTLASLEIDGPHDVTGPGDTPSRRRIFSCRPGDAIDEDACVTEILSRLARLAYRRPVTPDDLAVLRSFYRDGRADGGFDAGIQAALERMLAAPDFVFRIEREPVDLAAGTSYRVSDLELASRLASFLWSSIPDAQLLDVAVAGTLTEPGVLEQQVRRMLADARATALVDNFFTQWLALRGIRTVMPDEGTYRNFDESLRDAFERETALFLESQLREDRGMMELLSADYTYVNERLARHYGLPHVYGSRFRRVTLSDDEQRGGLLGHGSVLLVTSMPTRTSPVLRGKWLLTSILGTPPPPPPPNVPALSEQAGGGEPASVRDLLEAHRENPVCASCHAQIDPLGFALENFDAIGAWRTTTDTGVPLDVSGTLLDGREFSGLAGLRAVLTSQPEQFVRALTEKLLAYALGRELQYYDMPVVREIVRRTASTEYRWSSIMLEIVQSAPFRMKHSVGDGASGNTVAARR